MIYLGVAVAILIASTFWMSTRMHALMRVRVANNELSSSGGAD
jgi:hypothetical protein